MPNFNNDRDINMKSYLPAVLAEIEEFKAIAAAEQPGAEMLWEAVEACLDDQFISTATQSGIARREKMLSIVPYATDTIDDRRFRVLSRYNESVPYTRAGLRQTLTTLCGLNGYTIAFLTGLFTVNVKIALTAKSQAESVESLLERMIPSNMIFTVELLYNTWEKLKNYTWGALGALTWQEIKEEVLPHGK